MRSRAQQGRAVEMDVFQAAHALSLEVERENETRNTEGDVIKRRYANIASQLQLHPSARLKVIVVDCSKALSTWKALQPFVPDPLGKVKQLRYRGFEVQLTVRK